MESTDISYMYFSPIRNERVYLFNTTLVLSCEFHLNCVVVSYIDGRSERIEIPFSLENTNYNEEEKEDEEAEYPQAIPPAPPVTPQATPLELDNDIYENDETDSEDIDEEPSENNIQEP